MRVLVIGDIHGRYEALKEVLTKSKFDYKKDKLIVIGDVVDGGEDTYEVVEELLKIQNLVFIEGNHDLWFRSHLNSGWAEEIWLQQGGANTLRSYGASVKEGKRYDNESWVSTVDMNVPVTHQDFFNHAKDYHIEDNMLFVHGGFDIQKGVENTDKHTLIWDRELIKIAQSGIQIPLYDKVFVGHTTTETYGGLQPIRFSNLLMIDTGAGWAGKLCIMDILTEKYWLSKKLKPCR